MREYNDWDRLLSEGRSVRESALIMRVNEKKARILLTDASLRLHAASQRRQFRNPTPSAISVYAGIYEWGNKAKIMRVKSHIRDNERIKIPQFAG